MAVINGTAENDYLTGTSGNDVIVGGKGNDILVGNSGADEFVFENITSQRFSENGLWYIVESNDGTDMIYNYKESEDKIISNSPIITPQNGVGGDSEEPRFSATNININIYSGNANPFIDISNSNSLFDSITPMTLM